MTKHLKIFLLLLIATMIGVVFAQCTNADNINVNQEGLQKNTTETRSVGNKTPKLTVYVETNDVNPLNAGEYRFENSNEEVIDHVILFASNIRGNCNDVWLHHNPNQTHILNNVATLVKPLQEKGIKVLLGLLGDHTGVGFANLREPEMLESFAQQVADCVNSYELDGVDFDDEYAKYGQLTCSPALSHPNSDIYGRLIQRVKELLPGKLVTAFNYGYVLFDNATVNALDYMWTDFGCNTYSMPTGLGDAKWAKLSIHIQGKWNTNPVQDDIERCVKNYSGYGAIMMFNLRDWNASNIMNWFAPTVWNGRRVTWTGRSFSKNY